MCVNDRQAPSQMDSANSWHWTHSGVCQGSKALCLDRRRAAWHVLQLHRLALLGRFLGRAVAGWGVGDNRGVQDHIVARAQSLLDWISFAVKESLGGLLERGGENGCGSFRITGQNLLQL